MKRSLLILFLGFIPAAAGAQPYKNPDLPVEERVQDLLSRMTPEEKFLQLFMIPGDIFPDTGNYKTGIFGLQVNTVAANSGITQQLLDYQPGDNAYETAKKINEIQRFFIEESRLGIPVIPFDEALHGLVREGATSFPQSIALAATRNTELVHEVAKAIASETRSRGIRQVLSPVVNLAIDPRWGRTEETYGEDPFLVSEMGVAFVSDFELMGVITTPKHYVANVGDGGRDSYPIHHTERFMRETHLLPFEACVRRGGSRSIMTAYNSYDGVPCTANNRLLNDILKDEWGFDGFVISDAGGTGGANVLHMTAADYPDATAKSLMGGLDVIFQTSYDHYSLFAPPFLDGAIPKAVIDKAVERVLRVKFELGLFENPYVDPGEARKRNGHLQHRELARKAAMQSLVLLKNDDNTLPLSKELKKIALIGPDASEARLGGYSGPGINRVSILDGMKSHPGAGERLSYSPGCDRENREFFVIPAEALSCIHNGFRQQGLAGEYFNNITFEGEPAFTRIDPQLSFRWTLFPPDPEKLTYDFYSVRWTGKLTAPESGTFRIGIDGNDGYRLYIDDKLIIDNPTKRSRNVKLAGIHLEKNREYDIYIEFYEPVGNACFNLVWDIDVVDQTKMIDNAVELAARSDLAIVVAGIEEGEFLDRAILSLPGRQEEMIRKVAATGTPVVVVLIGGSPVNMTGWMDDVKAIIAAWYPGEEGGNAVAGMLFGDCNPAGRLPLTWPVHEGQLPLIYNHKPTGRGDDYINLTGQPLFPFGYGLSYTTFHYDDIRLGTDTIGKPDTTWVSVKVTNTGGSAGDEVVQLYIRDERSSLARPITELKGFRRIHLLPGETKEVRIEITPEMLSMHDKDMNRVVEAGAFRLMIGASSKDIRLRSILHVIDPDRNQL